MSDYLLRMTRREYRRKLTGRCDITRGTYPNHATVHPDVSCRVLPVRSTDRAETIQGGADLLMHTYKVEVAPYDIDVSRGDVLKITRSRDPRMVGRSLTVAESTIDEELTVRIVICEEAVE